MDYFIHLAILIAIFSIISVSLNLILGYTGLLSVTHAAFYGIGAYATAILSTRFQMHFLLSAVVGMALAALIGLAIGLILSKFRDDYYALASFGFSVIIYSIFLNWGDLTRGPLGIPGIARPSFFGWDVSSLPIFFLFTLLITAAMYVISSWIARSSFGRVLKAIREDEQAIQVFGYNTFYYKLVIFVAGAMMAALAGSFFAAYVTFIDPSSFTLNESIFMVALVILGGLANLRGSVLGAAFLILLPEALRFVGFPSDIAAQMRQLVYGLLLVLCMLYRPQGLVGEYKL